MIITRFDFFIKQKNKGIFIEVKNVTLSRFKNIAEFPDAVTERGLKHINELLAAKKKGFDVYLAFVIQREDCKKFKIAEDIDPKYKKLLTIALKNKLKVICYDCKFLTKGIVINKKINFKLHSFDPLSRKLFKGHNSVRFTEKESEIFVCLLESNGKYLNKTYLLEKVWHYNQEIDTHTLETHLYSLRKKIDKKLTLFACYHPSPRNVNTGGLNEEMMIKVLNELKDY